MVIQFLSLVANLAYRKGDYPTAEARYREAAQQAEQTFGSRHPGTPVLKGADVCDRAFAPHEVRCRARKLASKTRPWHRAAALGKSRDDRFTRARAARIPDLGRHKSAT